MHRSSSRLTREGVLVTPYAPRPFTATRSSDYPRPLKRIMRGRQPYSPLTDPHLTRYFSSKTPSPIPGTKPSPEQGTPVRPHQQQGKPQACYTILVKTGSQSDAGTNARVFISLHGSQGKLVRRRLVRGSRNQEEFTFGPRSEERFRVRGGCVGVLTGVVLESTGLRPHQGWFVEEVRVREAGSGQQWVVPCHQWLSLHHTDCQLTRTLKPRPVKQKHISYCIEVHTGNVRGGGTDANVFLTLSGSEGSSAKTHIGASFERGSTTSSRIACRDLGQLRRVMVEHDNSGFGPDWFLEKVVVSNSSVPEQKTVFACGRWLSRLEGDGATQCTLHPTPPTSHPPHCHKWYQVSTKTGSMRGAGTDANVFVTLYGSQGQSREIRLDNDVENFERGRQDTFRVQCPDLGELERLGIRHDNTGMGPGWYLEWVEVCECGGGGGRRWRFPCEGWLAVVEGEGVIERQLKVEKEGGGERGDKKEKQGHPYTLRVTTGNRPGAGTNANVYVVLQGSAGESGRVWLDNGGQSFLPGQTDTFSVLSPTLVLPVETVTVGHDNSGSSPGWFLEKLVVECGGGGCWEFLCSRWFCLDTDDGRIERELHPVVCEEGGGGSVWEVEVWTSDIRGAGTDANVSLQVHGVDGDSELISLGSSVDNFEQGERDTFTITLPPHIGTPTAITVAHDNANPYPEWHLDRVSLCRACSPEDSFVFPCGRWLAGEERSVRIGVEGVGQGGGGGATSASASYSTAFTKNPLQTELRPELSLSDSDKTESGRGSGRGIPKITVGVEGEEYGSDEFESDQSDSLLEVPLSDSEEGRGEVSVMTPVPALDSTIANEYIRQLRYAQMSSIEGSEHTPHHSLQSPHPPSPLTTNTTIPYTVHVTLSPPPSPHSLPPPHVTITLVGEGGESDPIPLEVLHKTDQPSTGTETFSVEGRNVGPLTALKVCLVSPAPHERWLIEEITVVSPATGHTHHFPWGQWVESGQQYSLEPCSSVNTSPLARSRELATSNPSSEMIAYEVRVSTADKKYAGTANDLHLIIVGEQGATKDFVIRNPSRGVKFQRGQTDSFQVGVPAIGRLTAVKVAHCPRAGRKDPAGESARWYLFQIVLTKLTDKASYRFLCRKWINECSRGQLSYNEVPLTKTEQNKKP